MEKKKRMKKICCIAGICVCIFGIVSGVFLWKEQPGQSESVGAAVGQEVKQYVNDSEDGNLVAKGENFQITKDELEFRIGILKKSGDTKSTANDVLNTLIEEKTIYEKAKEENCLFSEKEADAQVEQMKQMLDDPDCDSSDIKAILEEFDNPEEYWEYTKERIIIKGSIANWKEKQGKLADATIKKCIKNENVKIQTEKVTESD